MKGPIGYIFSAINETVFGVHRRKLVLYYSGAYQRQGEPAPIVHVIFGGDKLLLLN